MAQNTTQSRKPKTYGDEIATVAPPRAAALVECCSRCEYESHAHCHRFPPIMTPVAFAFPVINETDWCGEFKPRG